jgi:EAL domain-containing protein (putative c-di-GMP-specific phosphodiesterase class I)
VLERLLSAASSPVFIDEHQLQVSASIGVTVFPDDNGNVDHLVRHADQAMYRAKQSGKNQYAFFDSAHEKALNVIQSTLPEIKLGLQRDEFVLHYQPKVNMQTGVTVGVEALIRWSHPTKGLMRPAQFLPQIEGKQVSVELSSWVIEDALRQMQAWHQVGLLMPVSVNVGALHLQHPKFFDELSLLMGVYPQCRGMLSIEILETSALSDIQRIHTMMQKCRSIGVEFALDDFGTGYSSLSYLSDLPANEIKIDQRFVKDLASEQNHLSIVEGIVSLTQAFRRTAVAEGVETAEVGELLLGLGCKFGQGYYIARPMPAEDLSDWLATWQAPHSWRASALVY